MGTITAQQIDTRAKQVLQDETSVRWGQAESLRWISDGQREVVIFKPNVSVRNSAVQLVPGTLQSIPSDCISLMKVTRNMGVQGTAPGRIVTFIDMDVLDRQERDWHSAYADATVKHFMHNLMDPKHFYVYPPQPETGCGYVDLLCVVSPPELLAMGDVIAIDDIYMGALVDYLLYRAFSKDIENAADAGRAAMHQAAYMNALGGRAKNELAIHPTSVPRK